MLLISMLGKTGMENFLPVGVLFLLVFVAAGIPRMLDYIFKPLIPKDLEYIEVIFWSVLASDSSLSAIPKILNAIIFTEDVLILLPTFLNILIAETPDIADFIEIES